MMNSSPDTSPLGGVCVVHLVWAPLGLEPFRRFIAAYRSNSGGVAHRLLIVYNGFASGEDRSAYRAELDRIPHDELVLPQPVQDLAAYFAAAESATEDHICFLNSYSVPLDPLWLQKLGSAIEEPAMGAVGTTGSLESMFTHLLKDDSPANERTLPMLFHRLSFPARLLSCLLRYRPFPNPHLRTNGFFIRRKHMLLLRRPLPNKKSAEQLESGRRGLTARLLSLGLRVGIVGRDGVCYPPEHWEQSHTFRSGDQQNLLIADNRTLQYAAADITLRRTLSRYAWGTEEAAS